jgi:protein-tyrosine phosphatase
VEPLLDLHAHVLHDVDDGPDDLAESVGLLRALEADGVGTVWATPHVQPGPDPVTADLRDARLAAVRSAAVEAALTIAIEPGGELDLEYAATWDDAELGRFALGRAILIEFPWGGAWPTPLAPSCEALRSRGWLPIVAHPERARAVQQEPGRMAGPIGAGAVGQVTAASLSGRFGDTAQRTAFTLLEAGHAHLVASDAHNTQGRGPDFAGAAVALTARYGEAYAGALLEAAREVVAGQVPRVPAPRSKRRRLSW